MAKTGRPTKLTDAIATSIVADIRNCHYIETVAAKNGVAKETFRNWLKAGAREQQRREAGTRWPNGTPRQVKDEARRAMQFLTEVRRAEAEAEASVTDAIIAAGQPQTKRTFDRQGTLIEEREEVDWRPLAWAAERRFQTHWKPRTEQALTGGDGGAVQVEGRQALPDLSRLRPKELEQLHDLLRKADPSGQLEAGTADSGGDSGTDELPM